MRSLLIVLVVSLAATAHAQAPGQVPMSLSFDPSARGVPMSPEDESLLETGEVGPVRWSIGVGVAAGMGFGIGQTVQGRWRETGWIYTLGESLAATGLLLSIPTFGGDCFNEHCHTDQRMVDLMLGSLAVYAGFHIAEVIDAAVGPIHHNHRVRDAMARNPQAVSVMPFLVPSDRGNGGVAGLSLHF